MEEINKQSKQNIGVPIILMILLSGVFGFLGGWIAVENRTNDEVLFGGSAQQLLSTESEAIAQVAETVSPSVVSINVTSEEVSRSFFFGDQVFEAASEGSGIILSEAGLVVTNKHVIPESATELSVILSDGTVYDDIDILGRDPFNDIAFLRINGADGLVPAVLGDSDAVRVGEKVIAIGNALGEFDTTVTSGIISGLSRPIVASDGLESEQLQNLFQTDTAINPGNSGGPLLNISGEVIGINTAVAGGGENIGFAIPIKQVIPGITSVQENGELIRPYLGVRYVMLTKDIAEQEQLPVEDGAYITAGSGQAAILVGSPAEKAGIQNGDIITKVNGADLNSDNPLVTAVSQYQVGEEITITIRRADQDIDLTMTLEAAPDSL